jgi:hypothetical protein
LISVYTRAFVRGPTLIGLSSGMNTVLLPQPLANASATTTKTITVHIAVRGDVTAFHAPLQIGEQREGERCNEFVEHGAFSAYQSSYS